MYSILEFGAEKGELCTGNIQAAIDKCAAGGGGCVVIPAGVYKSGTIWLKDNVELHLEMGAVLKASENMDDYNAEDAYEQNFGSAAEKWKGKHLIIAHECNNVAVTGNGTIDGSGEAFFGTERVFTGSYAWQGGYITSKDEEMLRPGQLVCFIECSNVKVRDISIINAPCWGVFCHGCEYVQINGIKVTNPFECVNTDGIDIDCCRFVTISDCIINTGDDAVAIRCDSKRLKNPKPCENITVANCVLASNSSVFRIGVGVGEIRHVRVSNLVVTKAGVLTTYAFSYNGHGKAMIEDISFSDISAYNVGRAVNCGGSNGMLKTATMQNMNIKANSGMGFVQTDECRISDVNIRNVNLEITEKIMQEEKYVLEIRNINNLTLDSVNVDCNNEEWEEICHREENKNITVRNCNF